MAVREVPDSIRDQVLSEAAAVHDQILADRADMGQEIEQAISQFAVDKAQARADLTACIASVDQGLDDAEFEAQQQWQLVVEQAAAARRSRKWRRPLGFATRPRIPCRLVGVGIAPAFPPIA